MATTTFHHNSIGSVKASTAKDGVTQFLGLQYATLNDRFSPPQLKEYGSGSQIDATKLG